GSPASPSLSLARMSKRNTAAEGSAACCREPPRENRARRWSNDSTPLTGITSSPSRTSAAGFNARRASAMSGKAAVSSLADFECSSTLSPSLNARQRKPSHLGSYCQPSPFGIALADGASIGRYRGEAIQKEDTLPLTLLG